MSKLSLITISAVLLSIVSAAFLFDRSEEIAEVLAPEAVEVGRDTFPTGPLPPAIAAFLDEGRSWRAARALRSHLRNAVEPPPETILLAARTEAQWGGWAQAAAYLEGRPWLDSTWDGEGWFWLARAREEQGDTRGALDAYARYLGAPGRAGMNPLVAQLRSGLLRLQGGDTAAGVAELDEVRRQAPQLGSWMAVLSAEAAAANGDTATARRFADAVPPGGGMRHRARLALLAAIERGGDLDRAVTTAVAFRDEAEGGERAALSTFAGRLLLEQGDAVAARPALLIAMEASPGSQGARQAATLLANVAGLSAADRLQIARIEERHGNARRAAEGYRAVLDAGGVPGTTAEELRLALGRALFNAGQSAEAETTLRPLLDAGAAVAPQALLLTGRSEYRRGNRQQAFRTFERLAERFPGSVEGSEGLFLVADLTHDDGAMQVASSTYRTVADLFPGTDRAGLAMMRLAGIRYIEGDLQGAAAVWEEYRTLHPDGQRWLQASYWAGRAREESGDAAGATALYREVRERDPLSYYSVLATDRLGEPFWPLPLAPDPVTPPEVQGEIDAWVSVVDLLEAGGLHREAEAEAQRLTELAGEDVLRLYPLAEALNERGHAIRGVRLGQALERLGEPRSGRLLRILHPFPYRDLITAEAREKGLDPFLVAGLTRQESLFTTRISSPAGARGLMQIMPQTGAALARGAGIDGWDEELLFQPEINVHLGTTYLAEQMRTYDGSLPAVFSAYNAGPLRIRAWSAFPEYGNEEIFTERIPYRETRDYVKILTRNISVYRGLYGGGVENVDG